MSGEFSTIRAKDLPIFTEGVGKKGQDKRSYSALAPKKMSHPGYLLFALVYSQINDTTNVVRLNSTNSPVSPNNIMIESF